jgi:DedD protein
MNEHSLDDLIIGEPSPTTKKSKSLLTIIALIVIILLIGILLSKMILGTSEDGIDLSEENQTTFVSPDLIPMNSPKVQKHNNDLTPIKHEKLPKKQIIKVTKKPVQPQKVSQKSTKPKVPKVKVTPKPKVVKKPVVVNKPKAKQTPKPKELFGKGKPTYFVQVGAFNRDPNPKFLKKIENAGLNYVIHKNEKTRRVRVGPYGSYTEAKAALSDVNSSIGIAGFVVKQK